MKTLWILFAVLLSFFTLTAHERNSNSQTILHVLNEQIWDNDEESNVGLLLDDGTFWEVAKGNIREKDLLKKGDKIDFIGPRAFQSDDGTVFFAEYQGTVVLSPKKISFVNELKMQFSFEFFLPSYILEVISEQGYHLENIFISLTEILLENGSSFLIQSPLFSDEKWLNGDTIHLISKDDETILLNTAQNLYTIGTEQNYFNGKLYDYRREERILLFDSMEGEWEFDPSAENYLPFWEVGDPLRISFREMFCKDLDEDLIELITLIFGNECLQKLSCWKLLVGYVFNEKSKEAALIWQWKELGNNPLIKYEQ